MGWTSSLLLRSRLDEIDLSIVGEPSYNCDMELSLKGDAFSLQTLRRHCHGKLILSAWLSRGYVSIQQACPADAFQRCEFNVVCIQCCQS